MVWVIDDNQTNRGKNHAAVIENEESYTNCSNPKNDFL